MHKYVEVHITSIINVQKCNRPRTFPYYLLKNLLKNIEIHSTSVFPDGNKAKMTRKKSIN